MRTGSKLLPGDGVVDYAPSNTFAPSGNPPSGFAYDGLGGKMMATHDNGTFTNISMNGSAFSLSEVL
ncbi:hypothetical protein FACS1894217_12190 [Clostridia bacterium]|nr:hypothetical protein FACS1894217_12190 [Clostridia bacterium]